MTTYYNEIEPFAAAWLRELIKAGHIAPGEVDTRSIEDVVPSDLAGFTQCHFFAGIGVWSYALRCAGWSDDRQVWTGSCPCQPFSQAGKGGGFTDERHLWPAFHHLISVSRPAIVFGEQVASKDGLAWFDIVQSNLENSGYACGAVDTCAAGFGAPHIRQRLYWVAHTESRGQRLCFCEQDGDTREYRASGGTVRVGDAIGTGLERLPRDGNGEGGRPEQTRPAIAPSPHCGVEHSISNGRPQGRDCDREYDGVQPCAVDNACGVEHPPCNRRLPRGAKSGGRESALGCSKKPSRPSPTNGPWGAADWLFCKDGKWRPVEPCTFPLAHGAANRVGRLRGYGNAIVAPQAEAFIKAYMSIYKEQTL